MIWDAASLDADTLAKAERECLTRPSEAGFWDDRLYTTHGPVLSWAERGDDILAESNYVQVLAHLENVATNTEHEDADCCWDESGRKRGWGESWGPHDDDVIDATIGHWLVGSLRQIFVRVRDEVTGDYTDAFREAVAIALELRDYPVFDESDYSEREYAAYEENQQEALRWVQRDFPEDSEEDEQAILDMFWGMDVSDLWSGGDTADWDATERLYRQARDAYLAGKAASHA